MIPGRGAVWFSVPEWGSGGRRFESGRPDQKEKGSKARNPSTLFSYNNLPPSRLYKRNEV